MKRFAAVPDADRWLCMDFLTACDAVMIDLVRMFVRPDECLER